MPAKTRLNQKQKTAIENAVTDLWGMANSLLTPDQANLTGLLESLSISFDVEPDKAFFGPRDTHPPTSSPAGDDNKKK